MYIYTDMSPIEAVAAARRDATTGGDEVWETLDRCLRWHLLTYLQERSGKVTELRDALLDAADWADQEERSPWRHRWPYLLEILRDGERLPSTAEAVQALAGPEGRAAQLLAFLVDNDDPIRPGEISERLGMSPQQVTNLGRKLEEAGLVVRHKARGRATWLFATARGLALADHLPRAEPAAEAPDVVAPYPFWACGDAPSPVVH